MTNPRHGKTILLQCVAAATLILMHFCGQTLAEQRRKPAIELGPGSAHPCTTGEVVLELEQFLLEGDPHACGIIWDLAVDAKKSPELLAESAPAHTYVMQIAVDAGVTPPLVYVANGGGPGSLQQLSSADLSLKAEWQDDGTTLAGPWNRNTRCVHGPMPYRPWLTDLIRPTI